MKRSIIISLILVFAFSSAILAQDYISVSELSKIYKQKAVVVIDASKTTAFKKGHIPYAVNVYHNDLCKTSGTKSMLKPANTIAATLGTKGISKDAQIIIYDGGSSKYSGRMYWVLKYLGATNVKILNGNMKAWKAARKPVTATVVKKRKTTFSPSIKSTYLANMAAVKVGLKDAGTLVVDVRPVDEYKGKTGTTTRKGHIPGAINFHFKSVLNANGTFKTKAQIQALANAKGITKNKKVILYCTSSVRAGVVFMVFKTILKYPNVKVYDGAFNEWEAKVANRVVQ